MSCGPSVNRRENRAAREFESAARPELGAARAQQNSMRRAVGLANRSRGLRIDGDEVCPGFDQTNPSRDRV